MFSVSIFMVLLEVFVSQGQSSTTVAPSNKINVTNGVSATATVAPSATINVTNGVSTSPELTATGAPKATTTPTAFKTQGQNSTAVTPSVTANVTSSVQSSTAIVVNCHSSITPTSIPIMSCFKKSFLLDLPWHEDYGKKSSERYKKLAEVISSALEKLYRICVEVLDVTFTNVMGKVFVEAKVCLVFKKGEDPIKEVFFEKVKTGKLSENLPVVNDSAEFEAFEVEYKNYKAQEGECDKCDGTGGPFKIVGECVPKTGFSCNGLEKTKTKETKDCTTYCSSTALTVSSLVLAIGILLSSSFQ